MRPAFVNRCASNNHDRTQYTKTGGVSPEVGLSPVFGGIFLDAQALNRSMNVDRQIGDAATRRVGRCGMRLE
jgi:hypothetical protein